jgi:hypothetical protein
MPQATLGAPQPPPMFVLMTHAWACYTRDDVNRRPRGDLASHMQLASDAKQKRALSAEAVWWQLGSRCDAQHQLDHCTCCASPLTNGSHTAFESHALTGQLQAVQLVTQLESATVTFGTSQRLHRSHVAAEVWGALV